MTLRIAPAFAALATLTLFSCYPYPEPPPNGPHRPGQEGTLNDPDQLKIQQQRKELKEAQEKAEQEKLANQNAQSPNGPTEPSPGPKATPKKDYPFASAVPGKEGFVFSPYNNKVIDVREMPSGTLVQDPTYPAAEKKYFRVP